MGKKKIGLIGCGMISEIYLKNCTGRFGNMEFAACADLVPENAAKRAAQFGLRACTVEELIRDPEIEVVLNLTVPAQHGPITMSCLKAGKHVYSEKPLAVTVEEGEALLAYAVSQGLYLGCAPDTFLGGGHQLCRELLDKGEIGRPTAAQAFLFNRGPEAFHPNPGFLYQKGAGPVMDWGPYYLTALVSLLGSVKCVKSSAKTTFPERTVLVKDSPRYGETFPVKVPTYVTSILEFDSGVLVNLTLSFEQKRPYWESGMPAIQIYGTEGVLTVPDVNKFEGPVFLQKGVNAPGEVKVNRGFTEDCRGMGLCDMVHAMETGEAFCANARMGLHVLEVALAILKSAELDQTVAIKNKCDCPPPLSEHLPEFMYGPDL